MIKRIFLNDKFILLLIAINSLIIFISGFNLNSNILFILSLVDHIITLIFIVELFVKFRKDGFNYFKSNWNRLDFILILFSIPSLIAFYAHFTEINLSILLVFRTFRIFKTIRFLKFIPGMNHLIQGIIRALKTSIIALLGYAIYLFIMGIISFYLFRDLAPEYFSNPLDALYSTFKVFTIEGWFDIPEIITLGMPELQSFLTYSYFIFILITGGIIGMSLVNSIFVDAMVSDNNDSLEAKIDELNEKINFLIQKNE